MPNDLPDLKRVIQKRAAVPVGTDLHGPENASSPGPHRPGGDGALGEVAVLSDGGVVRPGGNATEGEIDEGGGGGDLDDAGKATDEAVVVRGGGERGRGGRGVEGLEDGDGRAWAGVLVLDMIYSMASR